MTARALPAFALLLAPDVAAACATCVASAYGDRSFNWAYLGLLATPFALASAIGGVLAWYHFHPAGPRAAAGATESSHPVLDKETT